MSRSPLSDGNGTKCGQPHRTERCLIASPRRAPRRGRVSRPRGHVQGRFHQMGPISGGAYVHGCARPVVTAHGSVGPMASLKGNGQIRSADVLPQETLAMALSYRLRVHRNEIGTRPGGVWRLHGPRRRPGALLVRGADASVRGKQVTTIESFEGPSGLLHPVQQGSIARWIRSVALARPPTPVPWQSVADQAALPSNHGQHPPTMRRAT